MAKVRNPFFSMAARGSLAGRITARSRAGLSILSEITTHSDKNSAAQGVIRAVFPSVMALWHSISAAYKVEWGSYSPKQKWSGYAYFCHVNLARGIAGLSLLPRPPEIPSVLSAFEYDGDGNIQPADISGAGSYGLWGLIDLPAFEVTPLIVGDTDAVWELSGDDDLIPLT